MKKHSFLLQILALSALFMVAPACASASGAVAVSTPTYTEPSASDLTESKTPPSMPTPIPTPILTHIAMLNLGSPECVETRAGVSIPSITATSTSTSTATPLTDPAPALIFIPTHKASLNFGSPVGDEEVINLLEKHEVLAFAGYTLTRTFTGAVRTLEVSPASPAMLVAEVRARITESTASRLNSHIPRHVRRFLSKHTVQDLLIFPRVREDAIQLLNSHYNAEMELAILQEGKPIIYAIAVVGQEAQLQQLAKDERVFQFSLLPVCDGNHLFPFLSDETERRRVELQRWIIPPPEDSQMLYERLQAIAQQDE